MKKLLLLLACCSAQAYGSVWPIGQPYSCGQMSCQQIEVSCADVDTAPAVVRFGGTGQSGTILFFSGGSGSTFWGDKSYYAAKAIDSLRNRGYRTVEVSWSAGGWLKGEDGPKKLSCRPAAVSQWAKDSLHVADTPFCATGNSGGASQVIYTLESVAFDFALPTGGPVMSRIDQGCLSSGPIAYNANAARLIDRSFGFWWGDGPCSTHDRTAAQAMYAASHTPGDTSTPVHFMFGEYDTGSAYWQGMAYIDTLTNFKLTIIPDATHNTHESAQGAKAIHKALLDSCKLGASPFSGAEIE